MIACDALVGEYGTSGSLLRRYVHGPNAAADDPWVWYEGADLSSPRWLFPNHQGSIVAAANSAGGLVGINSYDDYGVPASSNIGRFQYTGQIWIPELQLYHYKARAYNPKLGRFMQTDPIGYDDQINLYAYVGNDPIDGTDPTGTEQDGEGFANAAEYINYRARMAGARNPSQRETISRSYRTNFEAKGMGHLASEANYNSQESTRNIQKLYAGDHLPSAGELSKFGKNQGWTPVKTKSGPLKFVDDNGTVRLEIKSGSARTPGSERPHVTYRDVYGQRRDPTNGKAVSRKSKGNHRPIEDADETRRRKGR